MKKTLGIALISLVALSAIGIFWIEFVVGRTWYHYSYLSKNIYFDGRKIDDERIFNKMEADIEGISYAGNFYEDTEFLEKLEKTSQGIAVRIYIRFEGNVYELNELNIDRMIKLGAKLGAKIGNLKKIEMMEFHSPDAYPFYTLRILTYKSKVISFSYRVIINTNPVMGSTQSGPISFSIGKKHFTMPLPESELKNLLGTPDKISTYKTP
ncbi:MAG: hypothetical protein WCV67_14890 [Victivallaceae bacterium]|jgi:hypothetical protein